jgi:hypothetical protein
MPTAVIKPLTATSLSTRVASDGLGSNATLSKEADS